MLIALYAMGVYGVGLQTYGLTYGLYIHRGNNMLLQHAVVKL